MEPKIDILPIVSQLEDYVIIKKSNLFPTYNLFDDLDIVCKDSEQNVLTVEKVAKPYKDKGFSIIKTYAKNHLHLDFHFGTNPINFRFDFIDSINHAPLVEVESSFLSKVLQTKMEVSLDQYSYFVPSEEYEMVFRLLEYFDYPGKYRHLKYVRARVSSYPEFFNIIEEYTNLDVSRTKNLLLV